jgi:retinol dehydrogenase-12
VILADYNMEKGYQALQQLCLETGCDEKNIRLIECDLRSFDSIRHFVKLYNEEEKRLDVLICNAGIAWAPNLLTNDGFNTVIQVNYLGHFLLTNLLLDKLKKCRPSRIVNVASGAHRSKCVFRYFAYVYMESLCSCSID